MASGSRYAMLDWQRELNQIIKQTERNLHGRTDPYQVPLGRGVLGGLGGSRVYGGLSGGLSGSGVGGHNASASGQENNAPHGEALGGSSQAGGAGLPGGGGLGGGGNGASPNPLGTSFNGMSEQKLTELLNQLNGGGAALQQAEDLRNQQSAFKEAFSRARARGRCQASWVHSRVPLLGLAEQEGCSEL